MTHTCVTVLYLLAERGSSPRTPEGRTTVAAVSDVDRRRIADLVSEILEIDLEDLTETSLFIEDHDADSLRAIEILSSLEREFKIVIDQSELARMVNLDGIYEVVSASEGWEQRAS
jgi:acyl carrier protein